jgi:hypothetical protein
MLSPPQSVPVDNSFVMRSDFKGAHDLAALAIDNSA